MDLTQIAIVTFVGALAAYAVKELVDALINLFWPGERSRHSLVRLDRDVSRQMDRERMMRRIHLYNEFTRNIDQAVADLSIGATRLALVYAARDYYREISLDAPKEVTRAARRMCKICEEIMVSEYSDTRHNRFQRAHKEFTDACMSDTGQMPAYEPEQAPEQEARSVDAVRRLSATD